MSNTKKIKVKKPKEEEKVDSLTLTVRESLNSMGRRVDPYQEKLLVQLLKSFLVGGLSIIIDLIIYFILYHFVKLSPMIANIISFVIITIFGYFMSQKYVFDSKTKKKQVKEFLILALTGFVVTELLLFIFVIKILWNAMLVKVLTVILVIVVKILIRRFVFSKK